MQTMVNYRATECKQLVNYRATECKQLVNYRATECNQWKIIGQQNANNGKL